MVGVDLALVNESDLAPLVPLCGYMAFFHRLEQLERADQEV